ncbi:TetR/AcrR family transcriptional regulator [Nonomuraea sp. NPDC050394]|uniref:TetR/AcrR family transcriptional regulator n=1 Tax=Nonomuraea sp. NPDC050394 TaxID=3364363 RepID=UPI0037A49D2C
MESRRRAETQHKLFRATLEVAVERGLAGVSTHRVAAAAGLTTGAIYRNFEGRDHLIREAMSYYQRHVSDLDVADATSLGEWAHGYLDAYLDMIVSRDEQLQLILSLQRQLLMLRETDSAVRDVVDHWQESRLTSLEQRIDELASLSGERLTVSPRLLGQQMMILSVGFSLMAEQFEDVIPREVAHAAVDALLATSSVPVGQVDVQDDGRPQGRAE